MSALAPSGWPCAKYTTTAIVEVSGNKPVTLQKKCSYNNTILTERYSSVVLLPTLLLEAFCLVGGILFSDISLPLVSFPVDTEVAPRSSFHNNQIFIGSSVIPL